MIDGYKESPLGIIPITWETKTLGELLEVNTGAKNAQDSILDGKYAFFTRSITTQRIDSFSHDTEALFIAGEGVFKVKHYNGKFDVHQRTYVLTAKDKSNCSLKFFQNQIQSRIIKLVDTSVGSTVQSLRKPIIQELKLVIPPLPEQQKIAEILSTVDDKIEVIDQQIIETQELKKGLMQRLLTKGIGHTEFKDSPLGMIPKSWYYGTISNLIPEKGAIKTGPFGSAITKSMYVGSGYKIYGQEQVIADNPNIGNYFINEEKFNELKRYEIKTGDLLISLVGTLGKVLVIEKNALRGIINPRLLKITPNQKEYSSYFLKQLLTSDDIQNQMTKMSVGGTMSIINGTIIKSIKTIKPPLEEQIKISKILSAVDEKLEILSEKKTNYQVLKQGLMQQLLTGKIRVNV